jgi:hypothetical protein
MSSQRKEANKIRILIVVLSLIAIHLLLSTIAIIGFIIVNIKPVEADEVIVSTNISQLIFSLYMIISPLYLAPLLIILDKKRKAILRRYNENYPEEFAKNPRFGRWF